MKKHDLKPHIRSVAFSDSSNIKNMQIHDMLVEKHPDGVVCTDDLTAILVLQEAKKLGIKVPKELKVIGFDGTKLIQTYHSELTTIAQPIHDIATLLVDLLLKRIAHPDEELKQMNYTLPVKLIKVKRPHKKTTELNLSRFCFGINFLYRCLRSKSAFAIQLLNPRFVYEHQLERTI